MPEKNNMIDIKYKSWRRTKKLDNYWELKKKLPNKKNQEVVNEFLLSLKIANRSELTIILYRHFFEHFFADQKESFANLSSETILQWFQKHQGHVKEYTLKNRLSNLSSFYKFCVQEDYLERSPIKSRWFPRRPKSIPKYLEKEDIAKIRQQSEKGPLRNQLLVEFLLATGCRVGEVYLLDIKDIDLENRTANVIGKGKKIRQVHFTEKCAVLLERYLEIRKEKPSRPLFTTFTTGDRLTINSIEKIVKEIGLKAGMDRKLHPHRFRHTFATELLAKGAELSFIGAELGYNDLATTQIYARLPKREIIAQYRKYMG